MPQTTASQKPTPEWVTTRSQKLETWSTLHSLQAAQQVQESQQSVLLIMSAGGRREEPGESDQFQVLLEAFIELVYFPSLVSPQTGMFCLCRRTSCTLT